MPEIISVKKINEDPKYGDINMIKMESPQKLLELAETLNIPVVFKDGKNFSFEFEGVKYWAKQ
ncbi:MAG: hypothetical protein ACTSRG_26190 [Candidatus Helarchaeota archaeon]